MKIQFSKSILAGLLAGAYSIAADAQSPRIVVGITVDQLRTDYLEQLLPYFGSEGFSRLMKEGVYMPDVDFRHTADDEQAGVAVVYTGAWPVANGVASAEKFDSQLKRNVPTLAADPSRIKYDFSPEGVRLSTLADEFAITNGNLAKVYSLSADPQTATIAAGHAGNAAIFLDETTGRWTTPAYYGALPPVVANKNRTSPVGSKMASTVWRPLNGASTYPMGRVWNPADFSYGFSGAGRDTYLKFKGSAPFNTELTDAALDILKSLQNSSGQSAMLNISFSLAPIGFDSDGDSRPELVDAYVRLDADLGRLISALEKQYGKENTYIFLSSTGYAREPEIPEGNARIPTGEITLKKAESLLNSYLSASYGNGDYVVLIKNGKLYLDAALAEKKGIDIRKLRQETKQFLMKMGGVSEAFTIDEVAGGESRRAQELALGIDPKNAPDIFLYFTPGWTVTDDNSYPSTSKKVRLASPATPAFLFGGDVAPETVTATVEATALAPTIATAINIRAPNGAAAKPIAVNSGKR